MNENLVTIGIPTFNNPDGLERVLENITNQTYKNLEILISVNPSKNDEKYRQLEKQYKNVHWQFRVADVGVVQNFRFVLDSANGEYFMYAQDDDEWSNGFIESLVNLLNTNKNCPVAMSVVKRRDDNGIIFDSYNMKNISVFNALRNEEVSFVFMGLWRLEKLKLYSNRVFTDVSVSAQALLDGGVAIEPNEVYMKGLRHNKTKERVSEDPLWFFRIYYSLLNGVWVSDKKMVLPVAATNLVWVIQSYAAQILFLLPVEHPIRKAVRRLARVGQ